jgi:hypothetical protein
MSIYDQHASGDDDTETLYNARIDGLKTKCGDVYTGEFYRENLTWLFKAMDENGDEYDTTEEPVEYLDFTFTTFPEGTPEAFVREYIAGRIGPQPVPNDPRIFNHPGQNKPIADFFKRGQA